MSTHRFSKSLTSVSANNIVTLLDLPQELAYYEQFKADNIVDHSIVLEDLQCKVGLFTLLEADWPNENALASESAMEAARAKILKEGQKIYLELYIAQGNGPWELQGEEILQNKNGLEQPWALMAPWFSTNETALLGEDLKIGVKIANKAQGVGGLKGSDYLRIFGTWRKQTRIELKKKDDGVEALNDRISALETLLSIYGAPSASLPGSNGLVPAPPAGGGEFLLRGDRAWQNPNEFIKASSNGIHGNVTIPNTPKAGWTGLFFEGPPNRNYLLQNPVTGEIGFYDAIVPKWNLRITSNVAQIGNPLQINNGSIIKKVISMRTIISLPNIVSQGLQQIDIALTGAMIGGFVATAPIINNVMSGYWTFYCHAQVLTPDVVSLFFKNDWTSGLDLADFWIRILYIEF